MFASHPGTQDATWAWDSHPGLDPALHRQIQRHFEESRRSPFLATVQEIGHGRDITWTLRAKEVQDCIREVSLRTSPEALLRLTRNRWSLEGWHWFRDTLNSMRSPIVIEEMAPGSWDVSEQRRW